MNKNDIISEKELTFLISNLIITKMIFAFPRNLFIESGTAAWIEAVFMSLIVFAIMELTFAIYKKSEKRTILELAEDVGKKPFKILVALLVTAVLVINFTTELRTFSESVKIVLLPKTNIEYIMILIAIAISIGGKKGIGAIATINGIFFPICLVFLGFIAVFLAREYNINNIYPFFGNGIKRISIGAVKDISCFSDILVLNLLLPNIKDLYVPKKSGRKAVLIASITIILICLCYGLCYPYKSAQEFLLPIYQMSRMIRAGEYFQRFEAFFEFVWTITELIYATIYIYVICKTISEAFDIKKQNSIVYSVVAICIFLALLPTSIIKNVDYSKTLGIITAPFAFVLPIIMPILYIFKRRKSK